MRAATRPPPQPRGIAGPAAVHSGAEEVGSLALTGRGLSAALLGLPRVAQEVRVVRSVFGGRGFSGQLKEPRYTVLVRGQGEELGRCYQVRKPTLELLRDGVSPDHLELEEASEEDLAEG